MPFLLSILGGAGIAWLLIENGFAIQALMLLCVWIVLLWMAPVVSAYFVALVLALGALALLVMFWEVALGLLLGVVLFFAVAGGLLHALGAIR